MKYLCVVILCLFGLADVNGQRFVRAIESVITSDEKSVSIYVGGQITETDATTGVSVTKILVIKECNYSEYYVVDSLFEDTVVIEVAPAGYQIIDPFSYGGGSTDEYQYEDDYSNTVPVGNESPEYINGYNEGYEKGFDEGSTGNITWDYHAEDTDLDIGYNAGYEYGMMDGEAGTYNNPYQNPSANVVEEVAEIEEDTVEVVEEEVIWEHRELINTLLTSNMDIPMNLLGQVQDDLQYATQKGHMIFKIDLRNAREINKNDTIARFEATNLTWETVRLLPLRPLVKQILDTLNGSLSTDTTRQIYRDEMNKPFSYYKLIKALNDTLRIIRFKNGDGIMGFDSVKAAGIDPIAFLADIAYAKVLIPYYKSAIRSSMVREEVVRQLKIMISKRVKEFKKVTGYDLRKERNYHNIVFLRDLSVKMINPNSGKVGISILPRWAQHERRIETDGYWDMVALGSRKMIKLNYFQLSPVALDIVLKNLSYEMDKHYRRK